MSTAKPVHTAEQPDSVLSGGRASGEDLQTALTKSTPGPWRCIEVEFGKYQTGEVAFVVTSESAPMVASVANCTLIALAPALIASHKRLQEALKQITDEDPGGYYASVAIRALNAIPKELS